MIETAGNFGLVFLAAFIFFVIVIIAKGIVIVRQAQVIIIERFGKYLETLNPGINWIIPIMDKPHLMEWRNSREYLDSTGRTRSVPFMEMRDTIDMRETVYDFPRQSVITKDNVGIEINALLYFQITDPIKAAYKETTSLSEYVMGILRDIPEINLVAVMRELPHFVETLKPIESTVFKMYYIQELSISEITGMEFIDQCVTTEKVLKRIDKKFKLWIRNFRE